MKSFRFDVPNVICGLLFIALALFFGMQSFALDLGTAFRMGPGYFPFMLACCLGLFGFILIVQSVRVEGEAIGHIAWRGMLFILPAPIFFGFTVRGLGFVPALFLTALIASFASNRMKPVTAVVLATGLTIFCYLVFSYALNLPFRALGPWLGY